MVDVNKIEFNKKKLKKNVHNVLKTYDKGRSYLNK